MAPKTSTSEELLLEAVNLSRKVSRIKSLEDLIDSREKYLNWKECVKDLVNQSEKISDNKKLFFFQDDKVQSDFLEKGGVGIDINSSRADEVKSLISNSIEKWISALSELNLRSGAVPIYNPDSKTLTVDGKEIVVTKRAENYQAELLNTIFKDPKRVWHLDEILEDWYGGDAKKNSRPEHKEAKEADRVYQAGLNLNRKVAAKTGIEDFLHVTQKEVSLNWSHF